MKMKVLFALVVCIAVFCVSTGSALAVVPRYVHDFACENCHSNSSDLTSLAGNICITCHGDGSAGGSGLAHLRDPAAPPMVPSKNFTVDMASDAMNSRTAEVGFMAPAAKSDSSHNWNAPDTNPAAGASPPSDPLFYGRQNYSGATVSCSRCHDPHGWAVDFNAAVVANPKLLKLGVDSEDAMCVECHTDWDTTPANALLTHPLVADYPQFLADADPVTAAKFKTFAPPSPEMALGVDPTSLTAESILCSTCHGTHFTDSDSSSADTPASVLAGDGKLLKATGAQGADAAARSELCNSCHVYTSHGVDTPANMIGCLDCHSGHSYNDGTANYFVLRSDVDTAAFGAKTGLRYTSVPTNKTERATVWAGGAGVDGYCEGCHGDLTDDSPGGASFVRLHKADDDCNQCHLHGEASFTQVTGCDQCHGYPPTQDIAGGAPNAGFAVAEGGIYDYKSTTTTTTKYDESLTKHSIHAAGGAGEYQFSCAACHENNQHEPQDVLTQTFQDVFNAPANSLASANGALIPTYDDAGGCDVVYCHSNGRTRGATPTTKTPNLWLNGLPTGGGTVCDDCHGNSTFTMVTTGTNSGAHAKHLDKGYSCNLCHTNTALTNDALQSDARNGDTTGPNSGKHVNGTVDIDFDGSNFTQFNGSAGVTGTDGTCQNIYCHSNGPGSSVSQIPDWDVPNANGTAGCTFCHNAGIDDGVFANAAPATGSHDIHLRDSNGPLITDCSACHTNNGAGADHINEAKDWTKAKCNACHGATETVTTGNDREPIWGDSASVDCETCHSGSAIATIGSAAPPVVDAAYANGHGKVAVACTTCHTAATVADHLGGATVTRLATAYAGAAADAAFCNGCHAPENNHSTAAGTSCQTCHAPHGEDNGNDAMIKSTVAGNAVTAFTTQGVRASYANAVNTGICQTCHTPWDGSTGIKYFNTSTNDQTHNAGNPCSQCHQHDTTPTFKGAAVDCAGCHADEMASTGHTAHVQKSSLSTLIEDDLSDCVLCHGADVTDGTDPYTLIGGGNGKHQDGNADFAAGILYSNNATPANKADDTCANACHSSAAADGFWGDTALNCTACHNDSGSNDGVLANAAPGADHQLHLGDGFTCDNCHNAGTAIPVVGTTTHITDLVLTETDAAILTDMGTLSADEATVDDSSFNTGTISYVVGTKTCSNSSCHNPSGDSHSAVWESSTVSCTLCHNNDVASGSPMASGSHAQHVNNAAVFGDNAVCTDCHAATATTAHRSGTLDVLAGLTYTGEVAIPDSGQGTCTGSCHKNPIDPILSPVWGAVVPAASVCDLCHESPDNSGDHGGHWVSNRADNGLQCASCHFDTVNANADPLNTLTTIKPNGSHLNGNAQDVVAGFSYKFVDVDITPFTPGVPSTCTANCHSVNPKPWEVQTGCASCHGDLSYVDTKHGNTIHTVHIDITGTIETDIGECIACHGADIANYDDTGGDTGSGNHQNSAVELAAGIGTAASGCASACHASTAADGSWADTGSLNCTACHNNGTNDNVLANAAPATGSHNAHIIDGMTCVDCHGTLPVDADHSDGLTAAGAAPANQGEKLTNRASAVADNATVTDAAFDDAGNTFNDGLNSCSNTYCHDPSVVDIKSAQWGVDTADCNLCHDYDRNSAVTMASGSHAAHLTASDKFGTTAPESCNACHPNNATNSHFISSTGPTTVNQAVQFGGSVITGAQESPVVNGLYSGVVALPTDLVYGSCGTTECHNDGQGAAPASAGYTWASSIADDCNTCHDKLPTSNSHTFHTGITVYGPHPGGSNNCGECHKANGNNTTMALMTTHINGARDYADNNSVANHGGIFGTATTGIVGDGTVTVCNSCHGGQAAADLAKLNWVNQMAVGCESCHGDYTAASIGGATAPVRAGTAYDTDGHGKTTTPASAIGGARAVNQACTDCHDNNKSHISSTALTDPNRLNIIGGKDYAIDPNGFCNACHVGVADSAIHLASAGNSDDAVLCTTCHDQHGQNAGQDAMIATTIQGNPVSGFTNRSNRSSYANSSAQGVCQVCHDSTDGFGHFFKGQSGASVTTELATHNAGGNCISCHSHEDTPIFTAAGAGCNACHGGSTTGASASNYWPDTATVAGENTAGAHVKHMTVLAAKVYGQNLTQLLDDINSDTRQKALCEYCHAANTNDSDHGNTLNLPAEVFVDKDAVRHAKNLWNGADANATYVTGGCNTVDCHNNKATGNGASTFGWYDAATNTCTMCHTTGGAGANPTTGLHTNATAGVQDHDETLGTGCIECHNAMPAIDNTAGATHVNGTFAIDSGVNLQGDNDRGITVAGNITAFTEAAVLTEDSCAASCHADGGSWERLWSTDADSSSEVLGAPRCNVCHGYLTNFRAGMTPDHSAIPKINDGTHGNCSTCHVRPNAPYGTVSYHNTVSAFPDGNVAATELTGPARAVEVNASAGYDMANGNCTNVCHTNDPTHTVGTSAHFDANGLIGPTPGCNSCHNDTGGSRDTATIATSGPDYTFSNSTGAHGKHANSAATAYGDDVNHSTDGGYDYGCGLCHSTTGTDHLNGTLDLKLPGNTEIVNASPAFNLDKTCSGIYCHSDGVDVAAGTSPVWTGTFTNPNGDYCQNCHGNQPTTSSHAKHVVGIHFDDIYDGATGLLADANATNAGHGDVTTALTINCNMCHASTLNQWRNSNNTACVACHSAETADAITATDVDLKRSFHVNGIKDVVFAPVDPVRSKAQIRELTPGEPELDNNWQRVGGYKVDSTSHDETKNANPLVGIWDGANCTVACHNGNVATWGMTNISCNACHTQLPK